MKAVFVMLRDIQETLFSEFNEEVFTTKRIRLFAHFLINTQDIEVSATNQYRNMFSLLFLIFKLLNLCLFLFCNCSFV